MFGLITLVAISVMNCDLAFANKDQSVTFSVIMVAFFIVLPQLYAISITVKWLYEQSLSLNVIHVTMHIFLYYSKIVLITMSIYLYTL